MLDPKSSLRSTCPFSGRGVPVLSKCLMISCLNFSNNSAKIVLHCKETKYWKKGFRKYQTNTEWVNKNFTLTKMLETTKLWGFWSHYILRRWSNILTSHSCKILDVWLFITKWRLCLWTCSKWICGNSMENKCHKMWLKLPKTVSASSNKCRIITQNKVNNKFGYTGLTENFC